MIDILWPEITIAEKVLRDAIVRPRARMTAAMKAMVARAWGEPSSLVYADVTEPTPDPGEVLIDVRAVGCNFPDILIVQGKYQTKPPLPFSPGHEVAGVVRAVGPGVSELAVGQRVFALLKWGGYAERAVAPVARTHALPDGMTFEEAAAFGLAGGRIADVATNRVLLKNIDVIGVHWGMYNERDPGTVKRWMGELLALVAGGRLRPVIFKSYPLRDAAQALAVIASRESYGKVVLTV